MLDERGLLAVAKTPRKDPHALLPGRRSVVRGRRRQLARLVLVRAADRILELAHAAPERAPHLGQPLGPEHEQGDDEDEDETRDSDLRHHGRSVAPGRAGLRPVALEAPAGLASMGSTWLCSN